MSTMSLSPSISRSPETRESVTRRLFWLSIGVFFIGGFLSASVGLLVPQLKSVLVLDYKGALLVQLAFHSSYLLFALPAALSVVRIGYMRAIATGLTIMAAGCLALALAQGMREFLLVLAALLLLSGGQTILQIAANTVVTVFGPSRRSAFRLNLLQGFNSLGTVLGPLLSAPFLLQDIAPGARADVAASAPFIVIGAVLAMLATLYAAHRQLLAGSPSGTGNYLPRDWRRQIVAVLAERRLLWGALAIFLYVGAEVTIGTLMTNVLMLPSRLGLEPVSAGRLVSLYWAGAMVGRFVGAWLMTRIAETRLLFCAALAAIGLTVAAVVVSGVIGAGMLIAVGLCNAIMYPTIYALAMPEDSSKAPLASMWLCMAVVGGAVVPILTGAAADAVGLLKALLLPAACYVGIALFARHCMGMREPQS
ncbi:MAG: MFS transporter [Novosphingobium pentaromativorans]|uniref:MFS transporter n=1 Tax=Novosphingobium pentaromativorans TaxID=205844 RepID=A0A2W5NV02_9SPHN|nr:MFS transporter [Novosphingobium panipatense]PZQ57441.1 MAG: MFS transporter [Novosphingobium pentaromativorans]